jgi:hypothetical protein
MMRTPGSPHSLDLALSDFRLFGYVRHCLIRESFEVADQLFSPIETVLRGIEKSISQAMFLEWTERLEQCNATNGDCFEDI